MTPEERRVIEAARAFIVKGDTPDRFVRLSRAVQALDGADIDPEPPVWVPATWGDVGKGDRVRYQGHETVVGKVEHDHEGIWVSIRGRLFQYSRAKPVEIEMDAKRRKEHEL